jgi:hypothetical protein
VVFSFTISEWLNVFIPWAFLPIFNFLLHLCEFYWPFSNFNRFKCRPREVISPWTILPIFFMLLHQVTWFYNRLSRPFFWRWKLLLISVSKLFRSTLISFYVLIMALTLFNWKSFLWRPLLFLRLLVIILRFQKLIFPPLSLFPRFLMSISPFTTVFIFIKLSSLFLPSYICLCPVREMSILVLLW